jgi:uncharacterized Ntn-hydrolase superfamily protein
MLTDVHLRLKMGLATACMCIGVAIKASKQNAVGASYSSLKADHGAMAACSSVTWLLLLHSIVKE